MRRIVWSAGVFALAAALALPAWATPVWAGDDPPARDVSPRASSANDASGDASADEATIVSCGGGIPGGVNCIASKQELKEAHNAYAHALKLQEHQRFEEAYAKFKEASRLAPQDQQYFSAREMARAHLVFWHTERGNAFLADGQRQPAGAEFRAALDLDPDNAFVAQRLKDALLDPAAIPPEVAATLANSVELHLEPSTALATFHYSGDSHGLFEQLAAAYGMTVTFDDSAAAKPVRFNVDDVDFFTALKLACMASKTMWTPLDKHEFLIALDSKENHNQFDRMSLGTFRVPGGLSPQETTELATGLGNVCDIQKIGKGSGQMGVIEVRAPQPLLVACSRLLNQLTTDRPQVLIEVRIFNISHNLTKNIGVHIPNTFTMYNIPAAALAGLAGLGSQNISSLINQFISSGGINQAGSSALSGLLAQLQGQGNSIFSTPLATFGGGITFMGLSLDQFAAQLSVNESWARSLEHLTLHVGQSKEATFHVGERYPIMNASYAPIYNSPQISQVLGNQSYVAPFPSVTYEDLGLNLKTTPVVHGNGEISMKIELQLRALTGDSNNGVPVISNEEYAGSIRLLDGEPAVIAGEISESQTRALSGIPGLGSIPLLNQFMASNSLMKEDDELLIILTPHVLADRDRNTGEIWVGGK